MAAWARTIPLAVLVSVVVIFAAARAGRRASSEGGKAPPSVPA